MRNAIHTLVLVAAFAVAPSALAAVTVVDDFTADTLSGQWNQSSVDGAGTIVYTFDATTNADQLTAGADAGTTFRQHHFLRDDVSLNVGETLVTDVVSWSSLRDLNGLVIHTTDTPANRNTSIIYGINNGGGFGRLLFGDASFDGFAGLGGPTGTLDKLFINRTASHTFDLGYVNTIGQKFVVETLVSTATTAPGLAIGYHVDLNANGNIVFDNLLIDDDFFTVPPPADGAISGVTATASSDLGSPFNRQAAFLVDESGVIGLTTGQHGTAPDGTMWLSKGTLQSPNDLSPVVTFDLGEEFDLSRVDVWNYNEPGFFGRGVATFDIYVAGSDGVFGVTPFLSNAALAIAGGTTTEDLRQAIDLTGATGVQFVRFVILTTHNGNDFVNGPTNVDFGFAGLSEVRFFAAQVPTPSAFGVGLGLIGLLATRRRRR